MKYLLFFILFTSICSAQSDSFKRRQKEAQRQRIEWEKEQQEAVKRWREQMQTDRALIRKYFKGDLFKKFDKQVDKVLKSFDPGSFQKFFDDDNFDKMLKHGKPSKGLSEGDFRWLETPKEKILVLKMTMAKDSPLDIKIENNHIVVKGTVIEKKEQKTSQGSNFYEISRDINKTFPVPRDVDGNRAQFEFKAGEVLIKLPKKQVSDLYKRDKKLNPIPKKEQAPQDKPALRPIPKSKSDLTI